MTPPVQEKASAPSVLYRNMELRVDLEEIQRRRQARADAGETPEDPADELIPVAISSEKAVLRYDWWNDERYYEVLDHSPDSVDMSYATDGLPFMMSHRSWDGDSQHGLVENVRVENRVLRGDLRMSRAQRSQEIRDDILRGIRKKVSVGYIVGEEYEQTAPKDKDGIPTRRYTAWMPIEASSVPVPADYDGSGFDRSAPGDAPQLPKPLQEAIDRYLQRHPPRPTKHTPTPKERSMEPTTTTADPAAPPTPVRVETPAADPAARVNNISTLAERHGCLDKLPAWLQSGKTELEVSREINDILKERMAKPVDTVKGLDLSPKDRARFSFARALILGSALENEFKGDLGFEREVQQEVRNQTQHTSGKGGTILPFSLSKRAGIDSGTSTTGAPFKFTQPGEFIDLLRNSTSVMRAGATVIPGLTGPVTFPKQTAAATGYWLAENSGSDVTQSNLLTSTVTLAFKTIQAGTAVSRQALFSAASGNYNLEQIIQNDLARVLGLAIDLGALSGSGSANQPLGILANTNVGTAAALGTNGGTMAWGSWVDLETAIGDANVEGSTLTYLTNTKQRGVAKKSAVLGNTASGTPIWTGTPGQPDGIVNGHRAIASNQVPRNLTKGTATTVCSAVLFGAFEHVLIGQFGAGFEVLVDPYSKKFQNMIEITAWNFVDVALRYPEALATIKDAL